MAGAALSQEELGQKLLAALAALYAPSSSQATRRAANEWLSNFRFTEEAWMISHALLARGRTTTPGATADADNTEALFFAAQTLHIKLRHDFDQLPPQSLPDLQKSIIDHVYRFSSGPRNVLTKLCLALAAFAVRTHSSELWGASRDVVATLVATFTKSGNPDHLICLLELLHVLLAEADDDRLDVDRDVRRAFMHTVRSSAAHVLKFLSQALTQSGNNAKVHEGIFRCLSSWVFWGDISSSTLMSAAPQLVSATFTALAAPHLFDVAVDAALELTRTYDDFRLHGPVCNVLVPGVMAQAPRLRDAIARGDDRTVTGLTRLVVELGFSYMDLIVGDADINQEEVVAAVLQSTLSPDADVARMTLPFWGNLSRKLRETEDEEYGMNGGRPLPPQQSLALRRKAQFQPMVQRLAQACVKRCVLSDELFAASVDAVSSSGSSGSGGAVSREARSATGERIDFRVGFAYCFKEDCVDLLGFAPCMDLAVAAVRSAWSSVTQATGNADQADNAWRMLEGSLFAASALLGAPGAHIEQYASLQSLRDLIALIPRLCTDTSIYAAGYAAANVDGTGMRRARAVNLIITRACIGFLFDETAPRRVDLCRWFRANSGANANLLGPLLQVVFNTLLPSELARMLAADIPAIAAPALRSVCAECPRSVPSDALYRFYATVLSSAGNGAVAASGQGAVASVRNLPKNMLKTLIEAISSVVNKLPGRQARIEGFGRLLTPLATTLQAVLAQLQLQQRANGTTLSVDDRNVVATTLDCIHMVIRHVDVSSNPDQLGNMPPAPPGEEHPIIAALRQLWPMFDQVLSLASADAVVVEKLFAVNKHVIRRVGPHAAQTVLSPILSHAMQVYANHASSPAIYMLRVCISDLAHTSPDAAAKLVQAFTQLVEVTCSKYLINLKQMRDQPDVVDDFFLLCNRVIKSKSPAVASCFTNPEILGRCVHLGAMGLLQDHPDALASVLTFFERLLYSAKDGGGSSPRRAAIMNCMMQVGGLFMENLVVGVAGETPRRYVSHGDITLSHVVFELGTFDLNVLTQLLKYALGKLDVSYASDVEKQRFGANLLQTFTTVQPAKSASHTRRTVEIAVADFSKLARGNREKARRKEMARRKSTEARQRTT